MIDAVPRIAIFASGSGSNAVNLIERSRTGELGAQIVCCVCDAPGAAVIPRVFALGVPALVYEPSTFSNRDEYERKINRDLAPFSIDLVVLAGYMRICGQEFLSQYEGRAVNLHPSLLPEFPGRDAIGDALNAGVTATGVTVHMVDAGVDTGPIIAQQRITILPNESRQSLTRRIHRVEHELLPSAVRKFLARQSTIYEESAQCISVP